MSSQPSASGVDIETSWEALTNIPQILTDVRAGVYGMKALISTPRAAVSTGSPAASMAIVALGAEITVFLARTVEAILEDAEGIEQVIENYRRIDAEVEQAAVTCQGVLGHTASPTAPNIGSPPGAPATTPPAFTPPVAGPPTPTPPTAPPTPTPTPTPPTPTGPPTPAPPPWNGPPTPGAPPTPAPPWTGPPWTGPPTPGAPPWTVPPASAPPWARPPWTTPPWATPPFVPEPTVGSAWPMPIPGGGGGETQLTPQDASEAFINNAADRITDSTPDSLSDATAWLGDAADTSTAWVQDTAAGLGTGAPGVGSGPGDGSLPDGVVSEIGSVTNRFESFVNETLADFGGVACIATDQIEEIA